MEGLIGFIVAGLALVGSPGPNTLSLAATGAAFGARRGIVYLTGLVAGMAIVMAITASGVAGLLLAVPGAAPVLAVIAAAYIAYLAYRIATAPPITEQGDSGRRPSFVTGVTISLTNPKAYTAMAALFSGFVLIGGRAAADGAIKFVIILTLIVIVNIAWLCIGSTLNRWTANPSVSRAINVTFATLLVVSVAYALFL